MKNHFLSLDLSDKRYVFHVTDVHGRFDLLDKALKLAGFNSQLDALILNGDNIDRGPFSYRVLEYLDRDGVYSNKGNHELLLIDGAFDVCQAQEHIKYGGSWFYKLDYSTQMLYVRALSQLPFAIEVTWGGKKYGFVHADVCGEDWDRFKQHIISNEVDNTFMHAIMARTRIKQILKNLSRLKRIKNIDEVFFGHTPVSRAFSYQNLNYMDTGAVYTGKLTLRKLGDELHKDIQSVWLL